MNARQRRKWVRANTEKALGSLAGELLACNDRHERQELRFAAAILRRVVPDVYQHYYIVKEALNGQNR